MDNLVEEIHSFFPELKDKISIQDLKSPSSTIVRDFYCRVLIELGVDVDNVRKVQMAQLDAEGVDIIPELNLVTAIRLTLPFLKFQLDDLLSPEVKRNAQLMSQAMNFLHFSEGRLAHNNDIVEGYQKSKYKESQEIKELEELKDREATKLANLTRKLDQDEQTLKQLKEVIQKLGSEEERKKEIIIEKEREYEELEKLNNAKEDKGRSLTNQIEMLTRECEDYGKLIVQNPDEEKKNYEVKRKEMDLVLKTKNEYQNKYMTHSEDLKNLNKQVEELKKKIEPILADLPVLKECRELKDSLLKTEEEIVQVQKQIEASSTHLMNLEKKIESENVSFTTKLAALKSEESLLTNKLAEKEEEYKTKKKEIKLAEKKNQQDLENVNNRIASLENEYSLLLNYYKLFMEEFNAKRKQLSI